jgi:hypothetical protein
MPDLVDMIKRRWKFIAFFTLLASLIALLITVFSPKKYLSAATALPVNSVVADKNRLFNQNIEILYSDFGTPDELDRMEGTALLDTIFIAAAQDLKLAAYYGLGSENNLYKAASRLKKNSAITRTGYGELRVKAWDGDKNMAATMANVLMEKIQDLHRHLQNESNNMILHKLLDDHEKKEQQYIHFADSGMQIPAAPAELVQIKKTALLQQLMDEEKMIGQYQLAISTNPQVLMMVEQARPAMNPDKPKALPTLLFTFFGALLFSFLISLFAEGRKTTV